MGPVVRVELPDGADRVRALCDQAGGVIRAVGAVHPWTDDLEDQVFAGEVVMPEGPWAVSALSPDLGDERETLFGLERWTRFR